MNINNVEIEYINKRIQDLNPKVLVAIPVFNGEKIIIEAIQDVYNQSYQDFCVVIADNCSTDDTAQKILDFSLHKDNLFYIRHDKNIGLHENFKFLAQFSLYADYFIWHAADDLWSTDYLKRLVGHLDQNSRVDFVQGKTRVSGFTKNKLIKEYEFALNSKVGGCFINLARIFTSKYNYFIYGLFRARGFADLVTNLQPIPSGDRIFLTCVVLAGWAPGFEKSVTYIRRINNIGIVERYPDDPLVKTVLRNGARCFDLSIIPEVFKLFDRESKLSRFHLFVAKVVFLMFVIYKGARCATKTTLRLFSLLVSRGRDSQVNLRL